MEQMMGIEPTWSAWKAEVLPLNYICISTFLHFNISTFQQYIFVEHVYNYTRTSAKNQVFFINLWKKNQI